MNNLVNVMEQFRGKPFVQLSNQSIWVAPVSHHLINSAMPDAYRVYKSLVHTIELFAEVNNNMIPVLWRLTKEIRVAAGLTHAHMKQRPC